MGKDRSKDKEKYYSYIGVKEEVKKESEDRAMRPCLKCNRKFESVSKVNRLCKPCKSLEIFYY